LLQYPPARRALPLVALIFCSCSMSSNTSRMSPAFLQSARFHLADGGSLLINVPAHQFFHSDYDRSVGHIRRYSLSRLAKISEQNGFKVRAFTYWGLPLVPLLLVRKVIGMRSSGTCGFDPRGRSINKLLASLARCEPLLRPCWVHRLWPYSRGQIRKAEGMGEIRAFPWQSRFTTKKLWCQSWFVGRPPSSTEFQVARTRSS